MTTYNIDTICAVATPAGKGGVSVIRISGPASYAICKKISGKVPATNQIQYSSFLDTSGSILDQGLILAFKTPHSFTGEDVIELHCHGSPVVTDLILEQLVYHGARLARPGEFSERAFLNNKIDLAQAEAIADLINSASKTAAKFAINSLQGVFSKIINTMVADLTNLRVYVEASLDFPEEEVDFLSEGSVALKIEHLIETLDLTIAQAKTGSLLQEGLKVVIVGEPNAGKSTLLNSLTGRDSAIVTDIPGTTRDIIEQTIVLDGLPVQILDTAGLRESNDVVEQEGIKRARAALLSADRVLLLLDARLEDTIPHNPLYLELTNNNTVKDKLTIIVNKTDLAKGVVQESMLGGNPVIHLSAKTQSGIELLINHLKSAAGINNEQEGGFIARRRHIDALNKAKTHIGDALEQLKKYHAGELVAEDLRKAQEALGEITGKVTSDQLLGSIFSSFCIGK